MLSSQSWPVIPSLLPKERGNKQESRMAGTHLKKCNIAFFSQLANKVTLFWPLHFLEAITHSCYIRICPKATSIEGGAPWALNQVLEKLHIMTQLLNVSVKKFFLTKFSEASLEDLDIKDNFSHRIALPGWLIISAEQKILYCFSPISK